MKHKQFGSFVEVEQADLKAIGLINIVQPQLNRAITKQLPYEYYQRPSENSYINCIVCYYTDHNYQLGLGWLIDN